MELQFAFDRLSLERTEQLAAELRPYADVLEVGTSIIKQYGIGVVQDVAERSGGRILADLKTVDDARFEFNLAFDHGASAATVMALAPDPSIAIAVATAEERSCEVVIDLLGTDERRRNELLATHTSESVVWGLHVGKDQQAAGARIADATIAEFAGRRVLAAGGIDVDSAPGYLGIADIRLVIGSAVTLAEDPLAVARSLREVADRNA